MYFPKFFGFILRDVCLCSLNLLEEKASACNMLCSCAAELKEDFHLWIDEVGYNAEYMDFSFSYLSDIYENNLLCRLLTL